METSREKEIKALRRRLEADLAAGDADAFERLLRQAVAVDLLTDLRERKMILRALPKDRQRVRQLLAEVASKTLDQAEVGAFERQLDLMLLLEARSARVRQHFQHHQAKLPPMRLKDLLATTERAFRDIARETVDLGKAWSDPDSTVASAEREWQDVNGLLADIKFAA